MSTNPMIQLSEDQFLNWCQDMERKQEEQARQMKELQGQIEKVQRENDQLRAQIEKSCDRGKDLGDSGRVAQLIACNRGKEPISPDDVDTQADDELSSSSSLSLSLSLANNALESTKIRSHKRHSPYPTFNDGVSGACRGARKEAGRRHNRPDQAPKNLPILLLGTLLPMLPVHPTFGAAPTFYIPPQP